MSLKTSLPGGYISSNEDFEDVGLKFGKVSKSLLLKNVRRMGG